MTPLPAVRPRSAPGKRLAVVLVPLALLGLAASPFVPWEELTEADFIYPLATRTSTLDGHAVHYPTPTQELVTALEARSEPLALRHLAEARLELGDHAGALLAMERWAQAAGPEAWAESARWSAAHHEWAAAFRAAESALPGLAPAARHKLADEQVEWADAQPEFADALRLRQKRAELFPEDGDALEDWIRALEEAGRLAEAEAALAQAKGLGREARLLLTSDLLHDHGQGARALEVLDAALVPEAETLGLGPDWLKTWAERVDAASPGAPEAWRAALERAFDARALVKLSSYFQGQGRGDAALDLLRQVERRYESGLDRKGFLQLARHYAEIDAVPEAFRARLAAAQQAGADEQQADLAALVRLALAAGGRALPWGSYNDEPYRWVARLDRTPGFWTGGVAFLLTGQDWREALARVESESVPERTFDTARALLDELQRRAPAHARLPELRALVMARHVERGEGRQALALLPLVEAGPRELAFQARRTALLAMRQVDVPVSEELRLYQAQLRQLAADGSQPEMGVAQTYRSSWIDPRLPQNRQRFLRRRQLSEAQFYEQLLNEAVSRLEERDKSHRSALQLLLGELDRLPDAEALWSDLAGRIESWNLDDDLGPRYERALKRFDGASWWQRLARWYARRSRQAELRRLADELVLGFRGSELFARAPQLADGLEIPEQPRTGQRVRLVAFADWVRLQALKRFPHSPTVYREASARLATPERLAAGFKPPLPKGLQPVMTDGALLEARRYALLFVDAQVRETYLSDRMEAAELPALLASLEALPQRTPVEERLLLDGWGRLSQFERASAPADRLSSAYPGDAGIARQVLTLHRSLAALDPAQAALARAVVERALPALADPGTLITELGELEQERGRGDLARAVWGRLVEREPRSAARVEELATILWDYGYMREALDVVEQGRARLKQPWLLAFEAGVLKEELHDADGAVREYLASDRPNREQCACDWFEADQRALRRLSQLAVHERVRRSLFRRIEALQPGVAADEQAFVALLPLPTITQPDASLDFTVDDWIDALDQPNDPLGRQERALAREQWLPAAREALVQVGDALLSRALVLVPKATSVEFLDKLEQWRGPLLSASWVKGREVDFQNAWLKRRAELAPSEEERVAKEVERARYLLERGRQADSDALWAALEARIGALPQGAPRLHAEAERAGYLERTKGPEAAAEEWRALTARYPWSLGLLEDRLAFLNRSGHGDQARQALEAVVPRAAPGHRERLLERLAREALEAPDLPQARRAMERLLGEGGLDESQRLGALHLLARLRLREDGRSDLLALAKAEAGKLPPERLPDVYQQLARAADAEKQFGTAQTLWIEALNRRLERDWIRSAYRSAERAGTTGELLAFFERQRQRSPRDVRWAVAVREMRLLGHDLEGAVLMAKAAVAVRPERESLWREAAELLVRAGRPGEAADFLAGWAEPRPADEGVAGWRAGLFARAGLDDKALGTEQAALAAFEKQASEDDEDAQKELAARRGRAARRLFGAGLPQKAWKLLCPSDDAAQILDTQLGDGELAELALANDRFVRLLKARAGDDDFRSAAGGVFEERAKPEQREDLLRFIQQQLFPAAAPVANTVSWPGNVGALRRYWSFAESAGLKPALQAWLARRFASSRPGPWNPSLPTDFVEAVGQGVVGRDSNGQERFLQPELERLWVRQLVSHDRAEELHAFLAPRWTELVARVMGESPMPKDVVPQDWTRWLDDPQTLALFTRQLAARPEHLAELQGIFSERRRWDRLWAMGGRGWNVAPLLTALPDETMKAWFRLWLQPSPGDPDPQKRARGETLEGVSQALGRLVLGAPNAAGDPLIVRLRGPRTVAEVLGHDPRWAWAELEPAPVAGGERVPPALWGDRPGTGWYALETLARYREKSADAALVPLEPRERGQENERTRLAARLADALGDNALALEIESGGGVSSLDFVRFEGQLRRLAAGRGKDEAAAALRAELRRRQGRLDEGGYRSLRRLAEDLGLPAPFELLDPGQPVGPGLLAYLYLRQGAAACAALQPADVVAFRSALARRYDGRERSLPLADLRFWVESLWSSGAASLPRAGLQRLGGALAQAGDWLASLPEPDRAAALQALPDDQALEALWRRSANADEDVVRLLRLRVRLSQGDTAAALQLFDGLLLELRREEPLSYAAVALRAPEAEGEEQEPAEEEPAAEPAPAAADPLAARLQAWLRPFREARQLALVAPRAQALLAERRQDGAVPAGSWRLALELATPEQQAGLLSELENAYIRGDALSPRELCEALAATAPRELQRWLARWPEDYDFESVAPRARLWARLARDASGAFTPSQARQAAAEALLRGRARGNWSAADEVKAFDLWRGVAVEPPVGAKPAGLLPPRSWAAALPFWKRKAGELAADLGAHVARHPFDVLAGRAVLRSAAPADEEPLRRAATVLQGAALEKLGSPWADLRFVQLRVARGLLPLSARAALNQLPAAMTEETELRQRGLPGAEIDAALADVARIALQGGDRARAESALSALEDRNPGAAAGLRAQARDLRPATPLRPYRLDASGQPQPYRPRDLDWGLLAAVLAEESNR